MSGYSVSIRDILNGNGLYVKSSEKHVCSGRNHSGIPLEFCFSRDLAIRSCETSCNGDMKDVLLITVIFKCGGSKRGSFISDNPIGVSEDMSLIF
ncbi:hypothetical protein TNCV_434261 [Trichonephila clavipes]|nr:hypothetical protein TNCV_434261 [Trichonephila clavipes]